MAKKYEYIRLHTDFLNFAPNTSAILADLYASHSSQSNGAAGRHRRMLICIAGAESRDGSINT